MAFIVCYALQYALIQLFLPSTTSFDWFTLNTPVYTNPLVRWVEFFMGLLLYRAYLIMPNVKVTGRILLLILSITIYFVSLSLLPYVSQEYALFFLMTPSTSLLVLSLVYIIIEIPVQINRFFMLLGGASYVLYCIHFPFMEIIYFFGGKKWTQDNGVLVVGIYGVTVLLSIFIHWLLEKNVRGVLIRQLLK
ncbi:MAG: Acyltransferase family [Pseudomonadota bacterium]|jgi:peptidoglycan/LPS O-acetylase OafA/YrhL